MLHVSHVNKQFQGTPVLRDVSLTLQEGETVAIIGRSGSGKSTLLRCIHQLERVDSGQILVHGETLVSTVQGAAVYAPPPQARAISMQMGFVFQGFNLLPRLSAVDNVALPLVYSGVPSRERSERAREALERVGLGARLKHRPNQMSGGQQQRVAIARALVGRAPLILADEPTGNLDTRTSEEIMDLLVEVNREGKTVVLVTHEPDIAAYARRVLHFKDGRLVSDETASGRGN